MNWRGLDGDDTLTLDYAGAGGFFNLPITFNGGNQNDALVINDAPGTAGTGSAGSMNTNGSAVQVTGLGGGTGAGGTNVGVAVYLGSSITSGGGAVTVQGTGGSTTGGSNHGIHIKGDFVNNTLVAATAPNNVEGSLIAGSGGIMSSDGGAVQAIGLGGGSGSSASNRGVNVELGGTITSGNKTVAR